MESLVRIFILSFRLFSFYAQLSCSNSSDILKRILNLYFYSWLSIIKAPEKERAAILRVSVWQWIQTKPMRAKRYYTEGLRVIFVPSFEYELCLQCKRKDTEYVSNLERYSKLHLQWLKVKERSYPSSIFLFSFVGCFFKRDCCIPGVYLRVLSALILVVWDSSFF